MRRFLIPGWEPTPTFPPPPLDPWDAGTIHNYYAFYAVKRNYELGVNPALADYAAYFTQEAANRESEGVLPPGSVATVSNIYSVLMGGEGDTTYQPVIDALQGIHDQVFNDPNYRDTLLTAITSVAVASAQFWSMAKEEGSGGEAMAFAVPGWLKVVAGDVGGALGGAGSGIAIGTVVPGIGNAAGGIIGGIVGGACGSIAAA
jgi:hypothetical protein